MKYGWLTDIHLDHMNFGQLQDTVDSLSQQNFDGLFITGDISSALQIEAHLAILSDICPIYYILGNHCYYRGSIEDVRTRVAELSELSIMERPNLSNLHYLPHIGPIKLNNSTVLLGVDGWYSAECGDIRPPRLEMSDWSLIREFAHIHPFRSKWGVEPFLSKVGTLAREELEKARTALTKALLDEAVTQAVFLTHVPPWLEASLDPNGNISDNAWRPWFTNLMLGRLLEEFAQKHPNVSFTVLVGHTHTPTQVQVLGNLVCRVGKADYGKVLISGIINIDEEKVEFE